MDISLSKEDLKQMMQEAWFAANWSQRTFPEWWNVWWVDNNPNAVAEREAAYRQQEQLVADNGIEAD